MQSTSSVTIWSRLVLLKNMTRAFLQRQNQKDYLTRFLYLLQNFFLSVTDINIIVFERKSQIWPVCHAPYFFSFSLLCISVLVGVSVSFDPTLPGATAPRIWLKKRSKLEVSVIYSERKCLHLLKLKVRNFYVCVWPLRTLIANFEWTVDEMQ